MPNPETQLNTTSQQTRFLAARESVLKSCRALADQGFLAGTGGNVALRADDQHFCVTPSATDYYSMASDDICVLRLSDPKQIVGERKPSVESGLHASILKARPDCTASIHTHQPIASAYTLLAKPLNVRQDTHRELLGSVIPCAGYAPSGTSWLAGKVAHKVKPNVHAYLMRNHGAVCVGSTLEIAMERVISLEQACADFFERQLAKRRSRLSDGLVDVVRTTLAVASSVSESS